jgi:hypothetical protein
MAQGSYTVTTGSSSKRDFDTRQVCAAASSRQLEKQMSEIYRTRQRDRLWHLFHIHRMSQAEQFNATATSAFILPVNVSDKHGVLKLSF